MVLAHFVHQRRHVSPEHNSPSPPSPELLHDQFGTLNSDIYLSSSIPPPLDLSYTDFSTNDDDDVYFGSNQSSPFEQSTFPSSVSDTQLMTDNPSQNPRLRVQQSTPGAADLPYSPPPMNGGSYQSWTNTQDWSHLGPQTQQQYNQPVFSAHKRLSSESSAGSAGPASPFTLPATYPHIVDTETQSVHSPHFENLEAAYTSSAQFVKPLPAHTTPLNSGTLFHQAYNLQPNVNHANQYIAQQSAMRQAMRGQRANSKSGGRNLSTEQSFGGEYEGSADVRPTPNLGRTTSDAYQDELYNPVMQQAGPSPQSTKAQPNQVNLLSPSYRQTFNERLQAANAARTASPTTSIARERSPFRENSEFASVQEFAQEPSYSGRMNSAQQIREAQKMEADAQAYRDHHHPQISNHDNTSPNTISPQEVSLDYHESEDESKNFPLFPQASPQVKSQIGFPVNSQGSQTHIGDPYNNARSGPVSYSTPATQQSNSQLTFMPPTVPGGNGSQGYPFITHPRRSQHHSDQAPDFPATLSSMESTKSDSGSGEIIRPTGFGSQPASQEASSSQEAKKSSSPLPRPSNTSANRGTYTCIAPSCNARFENSASLHKHRRDIHPSIVSTARTTASPYDASASPATPSSTTNTQAAANNVSRNNQPGPHKCEKINPSTGKPCNTIFSRSYDLTRHEDTIHSNRKHKVRCQLCVEEKTFSRNDALTRHMRVVHPEVDMGGKGKRGGRS